MASPRDFADACAPRQFGSTNTPMHLQNDTDDERREVSYMESEPIHGTCE